MQGVPDWSGERPEKCSGKRFAHGKASKQLLCCVKLDPLSLADLLKKTGHVSLVISKAGIVINANQTKPPVLPSFETCMQLLQAFLDTVYILEYLDSSDILFVADMPIFFLICAGGAKWKTDTSIVLCPNWHSLL